MQATSSQVRKAVITVVVLSVLGVLLVAAVGLYRSQQTPPQPLPFNHQVHVQKVGLSCLYCHSNANKGQSAGMPTTQRCIACHQQIEPTTEGERILRQYAENEESIPWVPVAIMPDFVYFSHQVHVNANISCEQCHGEVGQSTIAPSLTKKQNMGWCLACHQNQPQERIARLTSCEACHK